MSTINKNSIMSDLEETLEAMQLVEQVLIKRILNNEFRELSANNVKDMGIKASLDFAAYKIEHCFNLLNK